MITGDKPMRLEGKGCGTVRIDILIHYKQRKTKTMYRKSSSSQSLTTLMPSLEEEYSELWGGKWQW